MDNFLKRIDMVPWLYTGSVQTLIVAWSSDRVSEQGTVIGDWKQFSSVFNPQNSLTFVVRILGSGGHKSGNWEALC